MATFIYLLAITTIGCLIAIFSVIYLKDYIDNKTCFLHNTITIESNRVKDNIQYYNKSTKSEISDIVKDCNTIKDSLDGIHKILNANSIIVIDDVRADYVSNTTANVKEKTKNIGNKKKVKNRYIKRKQQYDKETIMQQGRAC